MAGRTVEASELPVPVTYDYHCKVLAWVDGDTVDLEIDLGFKIYHQMRCRLNGLNCPESRTTNAAEKKRGKAAKAFSEAMAPAGSAVVVTSHKGGLEKYGRWLATVRVGDLTVNEELIQAGHAFPWEGEGTRPI